jgi:hypothetical protein
MIIDGLWATSTFERDLLTASFEAFRGEAERREPFIEVVSLTLNEQLECQRLGEHRATPDTSAKHLCSVARNV